MPSSSLSGGAERRANARAARTSFMPRDSTPALALRRARRQCDPGLECRPLRIRRELAEFDPRGVLAQLHDLARDVDRRAEEAHPDAQLLRRARVDLDLAPEMLHAVRGRLGPLARLRAAAAQRH